MIKEIADFTAVVREDNEIHILKAKIKDKETVYFQMHNKTEKRTTPCFEVNINFGVGLWNDFGKTVLDTAYFNRATMVHYYNMFKLQFLSDQFCKSTT